MTRTMWNTEGAECCAVSRCSIEPVTRPGPVYSALRAPVKIEELLFAVMKPLRLPILFLLSLN